MASVNFIPISALRPIDLHYQYNRDEVLNSELVSYNEGFEYYQVGGLSNYQDVAINSGSCFLLTDTVKLSSFFKKDFYVKTNSITPSNTTYTPAYYGKTSGTVHLQKRGDSTHYVYYDSISNSFYLDSNYSNIFINPISNTGEVELLVGSMYLQVDASYPFQLRASNVPLLGEENYRQRFSIIEIEGEIMIKTITVDGPRYLAPSNNSTTLNVIYATGCILGNSILNDYVFNAKNITTVIAAEGDTSTVQYGHMASNDWITYYMDSQWQAENSTVTVNKVIRDQGINYLVDFPYQSAIETGKALINIANLKTGYTPTGAPAPVDNYYQVIPMTNNGTTTQFITLTTASAPPSIIPPTPTPTPEIVYLAEEDATTPILLEDYVDVDINNYDGYLIYPNA
jgi:hypothetical protein